MPTEISRNIINSQLVKRAFAADFRTNEEPEGDTRSKIVHTTALGKRFLVAPAFLLAFEQRL